MEQGQYGERMRTGDLTIAATARAISASSSALSVSDKIGKEIRQASTENILPCCIKCKVKD
jgi:hypothetical protein